MNGQPRVSVGVPVLNGERYLEEAISSILAQDYTDFELLISDNASTDRTQEICHNFLHQDARVRYERQPENRGAAWNFNHVFTLSRGEYFKWAAGDDVLAPGFLGRCVAALDAEPAVVVAHPRKIAIGPNGEELGRRSLGERTHDPRPHRRFLELTVRQLECHPVFGLIRADVLHRTDLIGGYADSDRVLLADLALHGPFREVGEELFLQRDHAGRSVKAYPKRRHRAVWFDPANEGRLLFPTWRVGEELARVVLRSPLPPHEKALCLAQFGPWASRYRGFLVYDVVVGGRELYARARSRLGARGTPQ
ncbi:MAG: glycosyltransferase [Actinomycetota bacterium]|nr:glycosyltransferase [Actinomycetota bacterium]